MPSLPFGSRPYAARTRLAQAGLLLTRPASHPSAAGRVDPFAQAATAAELLREALDEARQIGMGLVIADAERLLRDVDARTRPDSHAGPGEEALPDGLSAREVEVLRRVAAGWSNRQIAEDLVLSVITVQNHVASIYRKARIHSRAEAAAYALRHGLTAQPPAHR